MNVQDLPTITPTCILANKTLADVYFIKTMWTYKKEGNDLFLEKQYLTLDIKVEPSNVVKTIIEIALINILIKEFSELLIKIYSMLPALKKRNSFAWLSQHDSHLFMGLPNAQISIADVHYVDSKGITMETDFTVQSMVVYDTYIIKKLSSIISSCSREEEIVLKLVNLLNQEFTSLEEKKTLEISLPKKRKSKITAPTIKV